MNVKNGQTDLMVSFNNKIKKLKIEEKQITLSQIEKES